MLEINRKLSKSKKHPVLTVYRDQKTAKYYFGFNNQKCHFQEDSLLAVTITRKLLKSYQFGIQVTILSQEKAKLLATFNGKFSLTTSSIALCEFCPEHKKCLEKCSKWDKVLIPRKIYLLKTFCGFRVLEHTLYQKHKNPEVEINKNLCKAENKHG